MSCIENGVIRFDKVLLTNNGKLQKFFFLGQLWCKQSFVPVIVLMLQAYGKIFLGGVKRLFVYETKGLQK